MSRKTSEQLHREYTNGTRDRYEITKAANKKCRKLCAEGKWHLKDVSPWNSLKGEALEIYRKRHSEMFSKVVRKHKLWLRAIKAHVEGKQTNIERAMDDALAGIGIPHQAEQLVGGRYFADFLLPGHVIVECDGIAWHDRNDHQREYTRKRSEWLEGRGYTVLHFNEIDIFERMSTTLEKIKLVYEEHKACAASLETA